MNATLRAASSGHTRRHHPWSRFGSTCPSGGPATGTAASGSNGDQGPSGSIATTLGREGRDAHVRRGIRRYARPTIGTLLGLLGVLALVALNALFTAGEFALVAADRQKVQLEADAGSRRAKVLVGMSTRLNVYLSGAQLGITICSIVIGFLAEPLLAHALHGPLRSLVGTRASDGVAVALALVLATVVQLIAAELVPKNVAVARAERTAIKLALPLRAFCGAFRPLIRVLTWSAATLVRSIGIEPRHELDSVRSLDELELIVRSSGREGTLAPHATLLLTRTIRFAEKTAADALLPRLEIEALPASASVADLSAAVRESGYSRYPVYGVDIDDIVGVVLAKDVLRVLPSERATTPVTALMGPVVAVPESRSLGSLLGVLRQGGSQMAVVIDEYGGTAGIVTLEDVLEEIVGNIDDEHDDPQLTSLPTGGSYVVEGSAHLDEVAELTGLQLPDGRYETLAGFVLGALGRIPEVGDRLVHDGWQLEVVEMDRLRVASIKVLPPEVPT
jgi:CBS domain containing-hemolysin-like protein